jgi:hypothetical protein
MYWLTADFLQGELARHLEPPGTVVHTLYLLRYHVHGSIQLDKMVFCRNSHSKLPNHGLGTRDACIHEYGVGIFNAFSWYFLRCLLVARAGTNIYAWFVCDQTVLFSDVDVGLAHWHIRGALSNLPPTLPIRCSSSGSCWSCLVVQHRRDSVRRSFPSRVHYQDYRRWLKPLRGSLSMTYVSTASFSSTVLSFNTIVVPLSIALSLDIQFSEYVTWICRLYL